MGTPANWPVYVFSQFDSDSTVFIRIHQIRSWEDSGRVRASLADSIVLQRPLYEEWLVTGEDCRCYLHGSINREMIALFNLRPDMDSLITASRAWILDRKNGHLEEVSATDVQCIACNRPNNIGQEREGETR